MTFGDSDAARVGEWIVAVGNPFGLGGTVTAGIISARGRDIQSGPFDDFLQVDAPINRGNSGGPLFNLSGEVIGINTAIYSPNGGSVGIGFAIPSSIANTIVAELKAHGQIERGWLGVQIQPVTDDIAASLGLKGPKGALVAAVTPDSPASQAGIKPGDVIVALDGKDVAQLKDLPRMVAAFRAGTTVKLSVWRENATHAIAIKIGRMPKGEEIAAAGDEETPSASPGSSRIMGLGLAALTPEIRSRYSLAENAQGVVVVSVRPDSEASRAGLRAGDVIVRVGDSVVTKPADVVDQLRSAAKSKREAILVLVERRGTQQFVAVRIGKA